MGPETKRALMHPPQWTHYQLALCFQHTLHRPLRAHTPLHKHMCAHTHTRRITNWNPNYGRMWMYTHAGINTHTHTCTHAPTVTEMKMSHQRANTWRESILNVFMYTHSDITHTHRHAAVTLLTVIDLDKGKEGI